MGAVRNVLPRLTVRGTLLAPAGQSAFGTVVPNGNARVTVDSTAASAIALVVRGAAGQTANLAEFQNSAGTVLAAFDAAGRSVHNAVTFAGATAGTNGAVPAQVAGYMGVSIGGTNYRVPYFNV